MFGQSDYYLYLCAQKQTRYAYELLTNGTIGTAGCLEQYQF